MPNFFVPISLQQRPEMLKNLYIAIAATPNSVAYVAAQFADG